MNTKVPVFSVAYFVIWNFVATAVSSGKIIPQIKFINAPQIILVWSLNHPLTPIHRVWAAESNNWDLASIIIHTLKIINA